MRPTQTPFSDIFRSNFTPLGKALILMYGIIYILELLCHHWFNIPVIAFLPLYPMGSSDFHIWQVVTHAFIHNPISPFDFLITCLVFYFFSAPVEYVLGTKRFLKFFYIAALGGALCGGVLSSVSGLNVPFLGTLPSILALIVAYGFINPEATILLMFILPVKAKYLSYGTIVITFLTFLSKANPHAAYHLGGILFGYLYLKGFGTLFSIANIKMRYAKWQLKRKRARFKVIDGNNDDKPTIH